MKNTMKKLIFGLIFSSTVHVINKLQPGTFPSTSRIWQKNHTNAQICNWNRRNWRVLCHPLGMNEACTTNILICQNDIAVSPDYSKVIFIRMQSRTHFTDALGRAKAADHSNIRSTCFSWTKRFVLTRWSWSMVPAPCEYDSWF